MQLTTYLNFDKQCADAFRHYHRVLGGELFVQTHGESPMKEHTPPEWHDAVIHARLTVGEAAIMGSDMPPGDAPPRPSGFAVAIGVKDEGEADRIFDGLAEGGQVQMPLQQTFWARRFGMLVDRWGIPWMVNCE